MRLLRLTWFEAFVKLEALSRKAEQIPCRTATSRAATAYNNSITTPNKRQYIVLDMPHDSLPKNTSNSFNREKCLKNGTTIPSLSLLAIRGRLCFRCFQPAERLMRCTGCNRSFYCSKECQKRDWEVAHKGWCKHLKKINEIEARESAKWRSWEQYRDSLVGITSSF
jgi:hypothetical protein